MTSVGPEVAGHRLLSAYSRLSVAAKEKFEEEARRLSVAVSLMSQIEILEQRIAIIRSGKVRRGRAKAMAAEQQQHTQNGRDPEKEDKEGSDTRTREGKTTTKSVDEGLA
jgi:hypothetical protein